MSSPPQPDRSEAVQTAQGLTEALQALTGQLAEAKADSEARDEALARSNRRNRRMIMATAASVALDLVLTAVVTIVAIQAHSASSSAAETKNASVVSCQQSNVTRAQEVGLWSHLVNVSEAGPHPGQSAAQLKKSEQELAAFLAYVGQVFAPRNCQQAYGGK